MHLKELVPPILLHSARRWRLGGGRPFISFAAAEAACGGRYEHDTTVRVVLAKTKHYRDTALAVHPLKVDNVALRNYLAASVAIRDRKLHVLDFGGACGLHYFFARALFGEQCALRWHVVETSKMAAAGRELEDGSLRFFDSIDAARESFDELDLVFSSSVLQCVPDPYATLRQLIACSARFLFLTRVGLTTGPRELYTVQTATFSGTGPGPLPPNMAEGIVRYPLAFARKSEVQSILEERYCIDLEIWEEPIAPGQDTISRLFDHVSEHLPRFTRRYSRRPQKNQHPPVFDIRKREILCRRHIDERTVGLAFGTA